MSELKDYKMVDEKYCTDCVCVIPSEVYLKSEADELISTIRAERDEYRYNLSCARNEIAELKDELQAADKQIENLITSASNIMLAQDSVNDNKCAELRHYKQKHCLDMAYKCAVLCQKSKDRFRWAEDENLEHYYNHKIEFFARWHARWLKIADQFKEAK